MRWMRILLCASFLVSASAAHGAIEAVRVLVVASGRLAEELQAITYPGPAVFHLRLKGFEAGRSYRVRALVLDAKQKTAAEHSWTFAPPFAWANEAFDIYPTACNEPGEWWLVVEVDGVRIAERSIPAKRVGQPPAPPLTLVRALVTASVSRNHEPRRPLEVLGIPSAAYYYIEVSGFVPGREYQYRIAVTDGAGKLVRDDKFPRPAWRPRQIQWFPVIPRATDAPGSWTLCLELDGAPVAQTTIEAQRSASRSSTAYLERWWPAVAAALVLIVVYVGYSLARLPRAPVIAAPVARAPLLDPSLVALVAANLFPIAFVLYAGANATDLLFLYWSETFIVAAYAILRIPIASGPGNEYSASGGVTIFVLFFALLTLSWGLGIFYFLGDKSNLLELSPEIRRGNEAFAHQPFDLWNTIPISVELVYMLAALFVSHGLSFVHDYLKSGAYLVTNQKTEMGRPANRMLAIYVAMGITGAVTSWGKGSAVLMLTILVALKTVADVAAHLRARAAPTSRPRAS